MDTERLVVDKVGGLPAILVTLQEGDGTPVNLRFEKPFRIGRDEECQIMLKDPVVSRVHAEVIFEKKQWLFRDLQSMNGTFLNGKKVSRVVLRGKTKIVIGTSGPVLTFVVEGSETTDQTMSIKQNSVTRVMHHYFADTLTASVGEHTKVVREAFRMIQKKQTRKYLKIIAVISFISLVAASYAIYKHEQLRKQQSLAQDVFYEMKALELAYAKLESQVSLRGDSTARAEFSNYWTKRKDLMASYDRYITELGVYNEKMSEKERTIYRVARVFGECEIAIPDEFVEEVNNYIGLWKLSDRLSKSIARARELGYGPMISDAMLAQHMPPQFFYLALQESEFDSMTCGPATRFGIAKGMWQFIPSTAIRYGLRTGPLLQLPRADPRDERHNAEKSTLAASRYLRDIYSTEAQASGLLVIASYNWGHNVVRGLIKELPENPRERNFWQFLKIHREKIPKQTYDYVFYIFSAAVIGENPQLFGFKFEKPLESTSP